MCCRSNGKINAYHRVAKPSTQRMTRRPAPGCRSNLLHHHKNKNSPPVIRNWRELTANHQPPQSYSCRIRVSSALQITPTPEVTANHIMNNRTDLARAALTINAPKNMRKQMSRIKLGTSP